MAEVLGPLPRPASKRQSVTSRVGTELEQQLDHGGLTVPGRRMQRLSRSWSDRTSVRARSTSQPARPRGVRRRGRRALRGPRHRSGAARTPAPASAASTSPPVGARSTTRSIVGQIIGGAEVDSSSAVRGVAGDQAAASPSAGRRRSGRRPRCPGRPRAGPAARRMRRSRRHRRAQLEGGAPPRRRGRRRRGVEVAHRAGTSGCRASAVVGSAPASSSARATPPTAGARLVAGASLTLAERTVSTVNSVLRRATGSRRPGPRPRRAGPRPRRRPGRRGRLGSYRAWVG